MITDQQLDKALEYLRESVQPASKAKSDMVLCEHWVKTTKARLMLESGVASVSGQEVVALAHEEYKQAVEAYGTAIELFTYHQMKRETAMAWLEAYRTQEASNRQNDRAHK